MFRVNESTAEIFIYDDIGPDYFGMVSDGMVIEALESLADREVTMRINSLGGHVFMASAIINAMRRHPKGVNVAIDGVAASAAASISMAGKTVTIAKNAQMMVHNPWTIGVGNASELRKLADDLDKITVSMRTDYVEKTGKSDEEIASFLDDETWMDAETAVSEGFADEIGLAVVASESVEQRIKAFGSETKRFQQTETADAVGATPHRTAAKIRSKLIRQKR